MEEEKRVRRRSGMPMSLLSKILQVAWRGLPIRFRAQVKQTVDIMRLDYSRVPLYLHVDNVIDVDRAGSCRKEPGTVQWIERHVQGVFYDVGANIGAYSLVAWAHSGGRTQVVAFEPGLSTFPQLCRNLLLNGCGDAVVPLNVALSDVSGLRHFRYGTLMSGAAAHVGLEEDDGSRQHAGRALFAQPLRVYALDDAIELFRLPPPNHLKIDVDGHELAVLRGAERTLRSGGVRTIQLEIEEPGPSGVSIHAFLAGHGFSVEHVSPHASGPVADYVFARPS
jgi:FkbM family methyltransferase